MSPDTLDADQPRVGWARFGYAAGDPVNRVDPSGQTMIYACLRFESGAELCLDGFDNGDGQFGSTVILIDVPGEPNPRGDPRDPETPRPIGPEGPNLPDNPEGPGTPGHPGQPVYEVTVECAADGSSTDQEGCLNATSPTGPSFAYVFTPGLLKKGAGRTGERLLEAIGRRAGPIGIFLDLIIAEPFGDGTLSGNGYPANSPRRTDNTDYLISVIERRCGNGFKMSQDQRQWLHREISKGDWSDQEIIDWAVNWMCPGR